MSKKTDAGSPVDWLDFAGSDLEAVNLLSKQNVAFRVCRSKLAEALEKILKADLISRGWVLEKTHDLQRLADFLNGYDHPQAEKVQGVIDELAEAYTQSRYPGFDLDDSEDWEGLKGFIRSVEEYCDTVAKNLKQNSMSPPKAENQPIMDAANNNTSAVSQNPSAPPPVVTKQSSPSSGNH